MNRSRRQSTRRQSATYREKQEMHSASFKPEFMADKYEITDKILRDFARYDEDAAAHIFLNRRKNISKLKEGDPYNVVGRNAEVFNPQFRRFNQKPDSWYARQIAAGKKLPDYISVSDKTLQTNTSYPIGEKVMNFSSDSPIILGPIIGRVTSETANIMFEVSRPTNLKVTLIPNLPGSDPVETFMDPLRFMKYDQQRVPVVSTQKVEPGTPFIFNFTGLLADTGYTILTDPVPYALTSSKFRTQLDPDTEMEDREISIALTQGNFIYPEAMQFKSSRNAVITLDYTSHGQKTDMWRALYERQKLGTGYHAVVHMGNNMPIGGAEYKRVGALKRGGGKAAIPSLSDSVEDIREMYRKSWSNPWTKHALANVPNIFASDELDIGSYAEESSVDYSATNDTAKWHHNNAKHHRYKWQQEAEEAYKDYQQVLSTNDDMKRANPHNLSYRFDVLSARIGMIFLDTRGPSVISHGGSVSHLAVNSILGEEQYSWLANLLSPHGLASHCKTLIIAVQQPLGDKSSLWHEKCDPIYQTSTDAVLGMLFKWRAMDSGIREVVLVSTGGITGGLTKIQPCDSNCNAITSVKPITQIVVGSLTEPNSRSYETRHSGWVGKQCFGKYQFVGEKVAAATQYVSLKFNSEKVVRQHVNGLIGEHNNDKEFEIALRPSATFIYNTYSGKIHEKSVSFDPTGFYSPGSAANHPDKSRRKVYEKMDNLDDILREEPGFARYFGNDYDVDEHADENPMQERINAISRMVSGIIGKESARHANNTRLTDDGTHIEV